MRTTRDGERLSIGNRYVRDRLPREERRETTLCFPPFTPATVPPYIVFEADRVDSVKLRQRAATINSRIHIGASDNQTKYPSFGG